MKKRLFTVIFAMMLICSLVMPAYAISVSSEWEWTSKCRPLILLPFLTIMMIAIESAAIKLFTNAGEIKSIIKVVTIMNLIIMTASTMLMFIACGVHIKTLIRDLDDDPIYFISNVFMFVLKIFFEIPIVYSNLNDDTTNKQRKLALTVISVNILSFVLARSIEKTLCYGHWITEVYNDIL